MAHRHLEDVAWAWGRGNWEHAKTSIISACRDLACRSIDAEPAGGRWRIMLENGLESIALDEIRMIASGCMIEADSLEQAAAAERAKGFRAWAAKACLAGGRAAHAFAKVPKAWRAFLVPGGGTPAATST